MRKGKMIKVVIFTILILLLVGRVTYKFLSMQQEIAVLSNQVQNYEGIGESQQLVTAYTLAVDVKSGESVKQEHLVPYDIPLELANNIVNYSENLENLVYKVNTNTGTILTKDIISDEILSNTARYLDVVTDIQPIGIEENDYVDVRINLPFGDDYLIMTHKKVVQVNGGVLKLLVDERDILAHSSMVSDRYYYSGMQVYVTSYAEAGTQSGLENYYPISEYAISSMLVNPNIDINETQSNQMIEQRKLFEESLKLTLEEDNRANTPAEKAKLVENGKRVLESKIQQGHQYRQRLIDEAAKEAAKNNR